jgi:hypothetical protein
LPRREKSLARLTLRSTSPAQEALVSMSTASWSPPRLAPNAGRVVVQASRWAMQIQRTKTMASKQTNKQATGAAKSSQPVRHGLARRNVGELEASTRTQHPYNLTRDPGVCRRRAGGTAVPE